MPHPIIIFVVTQGGIDTALGGHSVRSGRKQFRDASSFEAILNQSKSSPQTGTTSSHHNAIVLVIDDWILFGQLEIVLTVIHSI